MTVTDGDNYDLNESIVVASLVRLRTASAACSGTRDGSDRIDVLVLRCRSEFSTAAITRTEMKKER